MMIVRHLDFCWAHLAIPKPRDLPWDNLGNPMGICVVEATETFMVQNQISGRAKITCISELWQLY